jgi:preprotein translocase subunit SecD
MPRSQKISALVVVATAVVAMAYTLLVGNRPLLGLDLQGGVSMVLQPTEPATDEALTQALSIIRNRVDALGVAEPEISLQGDTIVVDLPGVEDQQRALELVGQTAELRFRPVILALGAVPPLEDLPAQPATPDAPEQAPVDPAEPATPDAPEQAPAGEPGAGEQSLPAPAGRSGPAATAQPAVAQPAVAQPAVAQPAVAQPVVAQAAVAQPDAGEAPVGEPAPAAGGEPAPTAGEAEQATGAMAGLEACLAQGAAPTPPELDRADAYVVLADAGGALYCLGPTLLTGDAIETANAFPAGQLGVDWEVLPVFRPGAEGIDRFNRAAEVCFMGDPEVCPTRQLAIVLDSQVITAPTIQEPRFARDRITITGAFSRQEAQDIATVLRFGALPVELEPLQTRTVSATIGEDALRAGIIAGIIGLALVSVYLLAYYRLSGLVAIAGLALVGVLLWAIISWFGATQGLALTTAGIVGLIVGIGVAVDSNIVYFENVKEAMRDGRTVRTAIERAYRSSISTIVKANVVALIAAVLLYWLTVGAVRGFAFYLGLVTVLDLLVAWFFMRPGLNWLARSSLARDKPERLGMGSPPATTTARRPAPVGGGS